MVVNRNISPANQATVWIQHFCDQLLANLGRGDGIANTGAIGCDQVDRQDVHAIIIAFQDHVRNDINFTTGAKGDIHLVIAAVIGNTIEFHRHDRRCGRATGLAGNSVGKGISTRRDSGKIDIRGVGQRYVHAAVVRPGAAGAGRSVATDPT